MIRYGPATENTKSHLEALTKGHSIQLKVSSDANAVQIYTNFSDQTNFRPRSLTQILCIQK
jgi:hypothetical protein